VVYTGGFLTLINETNKAPAVFRTMTLKEFAYVKFRLKSVLVLPVS